MWIRKQSFNHTQLETNLVLNKLPQTDITISDPNDNSNSVLVYIYIFAGRYNQQSVTVGVGNPISIRCCYVKKK
jgi:hypothetical protein